MTVEATMTSIFHSCYLTKLSLLQCVELFPTLEKEGVENPINITSHTPLYLVLIA